MQAAATDSFMAFITGDDQTYFNLLSAECRELQFVAVESHLSGRRFRIDNAGTIDRHAMGVSAVDLGAFTGSSASVTLALSGTTEQFVENLPARWIFQDGGWMLDECSDITPARGGLEGIGTDRSDPLGLGSVTDIGGWLISLGSVEPDDESLVLEFGGSPAAEGNQLFTATVGLSYIGADPSVVLGDFVAFAMVGGSTVYGAESSCETDSDLFIDPALQVSPGDSLAPSTVCREVTNADADDLFLRVTHLPTGTEYWFDLSSP